MAGEQQLRSAVVGGFQKQDVLSYIESSTREHAAKVEALKQELAEVKAARDELARQSAALRGDAAAFATRLEELTTAAEQARDELEGAKARLTRLEEEATALRARNAELEPQAKAYLAVKDRAAGIELEAHVRAQAAEAAARDRVKETKAELEQWMEKLQAEYGSLRREMGGGVAAAQEELDRAGKTLEGITANFTSRDTELERLLQSYRQPQVPTPLRVNGD